MKTLVLGLGNPILSDDGVGIHVVRQAAAHWRQARSAERASPANSVAFGEASLGGLRLLDLLQGCRRAVIVDAIRTGDGVPGTIYLLQPGDLRASLHSGSTHDLSLPGALALGRRLGMELPDDDAIVLVAIEVEDVLTFGDGCTPAVAAAIPGAVQRVLGVVASRVGVAEVMP